MADNTKNDGNDQKNDRPAEQAKGGDRNEGAAPRKDERAGDDKDKGAATRSARANAEPRDERGRFEDDGKPNAGEKKAEDKKADDKAGERKRPAPARGRAKAAEGVPRRAAAKKADGEPEARKAPKRAATANPRARGASKDNGQEEGILDRIRQLVSRDDDGGERKARAQKDRDDGGNDVLSSGAFWGAAAAGVGVGIALMLGRKVAVQAPTTLAGDWDKALALEHRAVEKIFDAMEATTNANTTKRTLLLAQLKHALAKHALQEENAVYPALRDAGQTDGADELNSEHGYVKQYLYELENMNKDSERFLETTRKFRELITEHVREEETDLYPKLKAALSQEENDKLTAAMNKEGFKLA